MSLQSGQIRFPVNLDFKFSLFTELRVTDANGALLAVVKEKKFSVRDEVRVYTDQSRQTQTHSIRAAGLLAGALDWKATRHIVRTNGQAVGALQAHGLRTLWAASYELQDATGRTAFTIRDDHPWLGVIEGAIDAIPFVGDVISMGFDYFVNPMYTVTDASGQAAYRVHKKRSFMSRRFRIEELRPRAAQDDELVILGLVQLVLRERERG